MELAVFSIPTFRKTSISKKLDKLARKAAKYGNKDISYSFGETRLVTIKDEYGNKNLHEFIDVSVSGEAPKVGGYDFLARVELMQGENLIHLVPGAEEEVSSEYRKHNGNCDHCNTLRNRNDVYVLSKDGEQIAVGRTCLRDFLGIDDPSMIVQRAQFFEEIRSMSDEDYIGNSNLYDVYNLKSVLHVAAASIRKNGYISVAKRAETGCLTTGDYVMEYMKGFGDRNVTITDEDRETVSRTLDFFRRDTEFGNTYMDNIRVIFKHDGLKSEHFGLASSAIVAAQRELTPRKTSSSNFVGQVKERLRDLTLVLDKIIFLGSGQFGPSYLHLMSDEDGNVFSWITGNKIEHSEGTKIIIDGTVKEHKIYKETKQTVLTRSKLKGII